MDTNKTQRFGSNGKPKNNRSNTKKPRITGWVIAILILLILSSGLVICHENEYKLVRRFGRVERTISASGLYFKIPLIESVDTVPRELLIYDLPASDVITSDKKSMIVDSYVLWRVTDPLKFAQTLSYSVANAENRIDALVYNATKNTISNMTQDEVIRHYLEIYQRCIQEEPKTFDAKGALSALDQISKLLGLDAPIRAADVDGNRVILTLGDEVGDRGD